MTRNRYKRNRIEASRKRIQSSRRILSAAEAETATFDTEDVLDIMDWVAEETGTEISEVAVTDGGIVAEIDGEPSELILAEEEDVDSSKRMRSSRRSNNKRITRR